MLRRLDLENFSVFGQAKLRFSPGLNVIVGENGLGKTHLLKLPYAIMQVSAASGSDASAGRPSKALLQRRIAEKLVGVFRPESLGRLARRAPGRSRCRVEVSFSDRSCGLGFEFATNSRSEVVLTQTPLGWLDKTPVYLPTRELLTIYPGFVSLYDGHRLEFEETWRDTCVLLDAPALRGKRAERARALLEPLEEEIRGTVVQESNRRFYLKSPGVGSFEMPLVAEGHRKLAMLARLVATGSLLDKGCLFWDEPESNLNPKLIRSIARGILEICGNGVQAVVATHSLFLLREFEMLLDKKRYAKVKRRYFALESGEGGVIVHQGKRIGMTGPLTALEEELRQSDRLMEGPVG